MIIKWVTERGRHPIRTNDKQSPVSLCGIITIMSVVERGTWISGHWEGGIGTACQSIILAVMVVGLAVGVGEEGRSVTCHGTSLFRVTTASITYNSDVFNQGIQRLGCGGRGLLAGQTTPCADVLCDRHPGWRNHSLSAVWVASCAHTIIWLSDIRVVLLVCEIALWYLSDHASSSTSVLSPTTWLINFSLLPRGWGSGGGICH